MTTATLPPTLLALSPGDLSPGDLNPGDARGSGPARAARIERFVGAARAALAAGLRGILLREPGLADGEFLRLARLLGDELAAVRGWFGVHDRAHLAHAAGAQGVHVGFRSLSPRLVREVVGPEVAIGFSSHAADTPDGWAGADYLFHGPLHETASKAGLLEAVGYGGLSERVRLGPPVWALGGLRPEHARDVLRTGARGVAVLGGIFGGDAAAAGAASYLSAITEAAP